MSETPSPLTLPECDCTDLDGFMLNVERLMASELVALSGHEIIAAALFLWCRAWKQRPASSLPDDDRVLASFARMPLARFKKLKTEILRGFVKCSDGRLYHKVLAEEATRAYERKLAFKRKREMENERLKKWREKRDGNADETHDETRFVQEGQGRDRDGTVLSNSAPNGAGELPLPKPMAPKPEKIDPWKEVYDRGKQVFGREAGGIITNLKKTYDGKPRKVLAKIEDAAEKRNPLEWINAFLWEHGPPGIEVGAVAPLP